MELPQIIGGINLYKTFRTVIVTIIATMAVILTVEYFFGFPLISLESYTEKKFDSVEKILSDNYYKEYDKDEAVEVAIDAMVNSLGDRYTRYMSDVEWGELEDSIRGVYDGFGFTVASDGESIYVYKVHKKSSAYEEGIRKNDIVKKINGKKIKSEKDYVSISEKIKEDEEDTMTVEIYRQSEDKGYKFTLHKSEVVVQNLFAKKLDGNVAYIKMNVFDEKCDSEFKKYADKLVNKKGCTSLIVDLRDNPGGYYEKAIDIADYLLPECLVSYTVDKKGKKEEHYSDKEYLDVPLVMLVDGNSASASEVLTGAIKGNKRGVVVGERTYGKGLVQRTYKFTDDTALNVTIARYYIPTGVCIDGKGIKPDYKISLPKGVKVGKVKAKDDTQLQKAIKVAKRKAGE